MSDEETLPEPADADRQWSRIYSNSETSSTQTFKVKTRHWRRRVGHLIEDKRAHLFILFLLTVDVGCILADLGYTILTRNCGEEDTPKWLEILSHISFGITCFFLLEIILAFFAFGFRYYNPFGSFPLARLHLFDAIVIITAFVLELVLRGRNGEFAALLIALRFWRIVKLMEGIALGTEELNAGAAEELASTKEQLRRTEAELRASREEVEGLRLRLQAAGISPGDA